MGRIGRSFQLVDESYRVLMQDKELMVLPLLSGVVIAAIIGTLQGVYVASLYRYAAEGHAVSGFDKALLDQAFVPKAH